ncbi:9988_t:CDS:1, partial [Dentiscutata erythropus]
NELTFEEFKQRYINIIIFKEDYTSVTCTNYRNVKTSKELGEAKNLRIDRDHNGARNILINSWRPSSKVLNYESDT